MLKQKIVFGNTTKSSARLLGITSMPGMMLRRFIFHEPWDTDLLLFACCTFLDILTKRRCIECNAMYVWLAAAYPYPNEKKYYVKTDKGFLHNLHRDMRLDFGHDILDHMFKNKNWKDLGDCEHWKTSTEIKPI